MGHILEAFSMGFFTKHFVFVFALVAQTGLTTAVFGQSLAPPPPVRLVTISQPDYPGLVKLRAVLDKAFVLAGLTYSLDFKPPERALLEFRRGQYDGDPDRYERFFEVFPKAIRIDPHIATVQYFAVTGTALAPIQSWRDLREYAIAYPLGYKAVEAHVREVPRKFTPSSEASCVEMVIAKRVDVCVLPSDSPDAWDGQDAFKGRVYSQRFESINTHLWLGPNQTDAAQRLTKALRELEHSGELQKIMGRQRARK